MRYTLRLIRKENDKWVSYNRNHKGYITAHNSLLDAFKFSFPFIIKQANYEKD